MTRLKLSRWLAVLTLAISLAPNTASVLEADTLSIGGTFHMDQLTGIVGADLAEVFAHENENTWSLTLFGITQSLEEIDDYENGHDIETYITRVHATSFDFEFVGPDAEVLNEVISQQLTRSSLGGDLFLDLSNLYNYTDFWPGNSFWDIGLLPLDDAAGVSFFARGYKAYSAPPYSIGGAWFPTEGGGEGFPLVEPQSITSQRTSIHDSRPGSSGELVSTIDFVDIDLFTQILSGDYSGNGTVGPEDFNLWKANYGSTTNLAADGNGNHVVDAADYTVWRNHLGASLGAGSGAALPSAEPLSPAVPEPATLALASLCLLGFVAGSRRLAI